MAEYRVTDPETGKTLVLTGDAPPTEIELDEIFSQYKPKQTEQTLPEGTQLQGAGEALQSMGANFIGSIGAGLGGIYELITSGNPEQAANVVRGMQQEIANRFAPETQRGQSYQQGAAEILNEAGQAIKTAPSMLIGGLSQPFIGTDEAKKLQQNIQQKETGELLGDVTLSATGSPLAATAVRTLTPDLSEIAGAGIGGAIAKTARRSLGTKVDEGVKAAELEVARTGGQRPIGAPPTESGVQQTAKAIQSATPEQVAAIIDADPRILQAIDSLEIDAEPIYSQLSRNQQYREVEGGLRSLPGSELNAQAIKFVEATKRKADELIETFGGVRDKALLSDQFRQDSIKTINELSDAANEIYSQIDYNVRKSETAIPQSTVDFLYSKADELGGIDNLNPKFRKLAKELEENPTIGLIDQRRKDIGQAAFKNSGLFKDAEEGFAKALYGRLTDDMNAILDDLGMKDISDQGKTLVRERKVLEGNLQDLLGKNLSKDLTAIVGAATKGLATGRVNQFVETINKIPKEYRKKAVVTSLNDIFRGKGQGMESFNANDYLKFWNELQRNPRARTALFRELPKGSRGALTALADIAKGINQSDRTIIRTGLIQSFFEPNSGLVSKMLGNAGRALAASKAGPAGSAMYNAVSDLLSQTTSPAQRVATLIATPSFQNVVKKAMNERISQPGQASAALKAAEEQLKRTKQYQDWVNTLPDADKMAASAGLLTYLATVGEENGNNNQQ